MTLAVLDRARRSLAEGLVHPHLQSGDGRWHALWGATLDESLREELDALADAAPAVCAFPFEGDTDAFVYDLYGCAVDELARRALRRTRARGDARDGAPERRRSMRRTSALPANAGYPALERRPNAWVDGDSGRRSRAGTSACDSTRTSTRLPRVSLELWLQAADDPTLALPASLLRDGGEDVFAFLRDGDPHAAIERRLETIAPILAGAGIAAPDETSPAVELDTDQVRAFLARAVPRLEELAVPVLLPRAWVSSTSRVNLVATGSPTTSSGLHRDAIASFDTSRRRRRRAHGGRAAGARCREGAADQAPGAMARAPHDRRRARAPLPRAAQRAARDDRARPRHLRARDRRGGRRARRGRLDADLEALLFGTDDRRFQPSRRLPACSTTCSASRSAGTAGFASSAICGRRDPRRRHGLGKTVQAIATFVSEREHAGGPLGPTLVVSPMSVTQQWAREIARFAPGLRVHLHHGPSRLTGAAFGRGALERCRRHVLRRRDA